VTATAQLGSLARGDLTTSPLKFPTRPFDQASLYCSAYLEELARASQSINLDDVDAAAKLLLDAYSRGATVFSCGNGGSAAIANHLQCDHLKGVRTLTDLLPRVVSLSSNVELLTAIANDISYEDVFTFQLQSQAKEGDVLVVISSSGRSNNIVKALAWARAHNIETLAFTGFDGGLAKGLANVAIHIDCENYGIIEDLHQASMHAMAQYVRQSRMTPDAITSTLF
jgi:D-sedoheptulose 7-phosphate isomerase/D-glycero-D-manno-heptose 1,7-bisphosphate phosphatase